METNNELTGTEKERVLARVKKMMALANDAAASEGERDNALRMAHATLAKYNLTMAQADATGQKATEKRTDGTITIREYAWMRGVAQSIGRLFFCDFFYTPLPAKHAIYCFVGKESNVYTALEMAKYVISSINREGMSRAQQIGETPRGTYWRNFCKGAGYAIHQRCYEIVQAAQQQKPSTGTALVLASVYQLEAQANKEYMSKEMGVRVKTATDKQRAPGVGFHDGREYGGTVGLNRQLGG